MHNSVTYDFQLANVNANYVKYNDIIDISKLYTCQYATVMSVIDQKFEKKRGSVDFCYTGISDRALS